MIMFDGIAQGATYYFNVNWSPGGVMLSRGIALWITCCVQQQRRQHISHGEPGTVQPDGTSKLQTNYTVQPDCTSKLQTNQCIYCCKQLGLKHDMYACALYEGRCPYRTANATIPGKGNILDNQLTCLFFSCEVRSDCQHEVAIIT